MEPNLPTISQRKIKFLKNYKMFFKQISPPYFSLFIYYFNFRSIIASVNSSFTLTIRTSSTLCLNGTVQPSEKTELSLFSRTKQIMFHFYIFPLVLYFCIFHKQKRKIKKKPQNRKWKFLENFFLKKPT